jgi:hypothetical protein
MQRERGRLRRHEVVLFVLAGSALAVLWLTPARSRVSGRALALAVGFGLVFGACG